MQDICWLTNTCEQSRRVNLLPWDRCVCATTQQIKSAEVTCIGQREQLGPFPVRAPLLRALTQGILQDLQSVLRTTTLFLGCLQRLTPDAYVISCIAFCMNLP